ncbi:Peptide transporter [Trichoderma lentiforme]|uniref:Peptide transporter n=1 Tax=Trichoderma lentiforme TaxID=1567552 RepID=A0A9P4X1U9_9HYPO|nr:Peptide transporter [Trichoderma lentiforme]
MARQQESYARHEATEEEVKELRHVVDSVPFIVWIALVANATERFTFYAVTTPWQNYIQNSADNIAVPGALGLGQATATNISSAFLFLSFLVPTIFAILSDTWLGRYKTLFLSYLLNFCGCLVLFITSLPVVKSQSTKVVGLGFAMILLALSTGGVKATASPFIGDQYAETAPQLIITKKGEHVVTDRALTLQYIYNAYKHSEFIFGCIYLPRKARWLLGRLSVTTMYSLDAGTFASGISQIFCKVKLRPQANVLPQASRVIMCSARHRFKWEAATAVYQSENYGRQVDWDDRFVFEIKRGLQACKVMACFVPFHLCMNQITNNLVSQAGQMKLGGIPNDTIQALNSIACVILGPVMQKMVYPIVRKFGFPFGPIARITWAFIMMSTSMAFAEGVQKLIYTKGPCYGHPLQCENTPNNVSVWVQTPVYFLLAFAEILGFTTLSEYSYSEAPKNMRSLVQAMAQLSSGAGSALGMAVSPLSKDPQILYLYAGLAVTMIIAAPTFWLTFRGYDEMETYKETQHSDAENSPVEGLMNPAIPEPVNTGEKEEGCVKISS